MLQSLIHDKKYNLYHHNWGRNNFFAVKQASAMQRVRHNIYMDDWAFPEMQPKSETVLQVNNKIIFLCFAAA